MSDFIGPLILMVVGIVVLLWMAGELLPASGRLFRTLRGRGEVDVLDEHLRAEIDGDGEAYAADLGDLLSGALLGCGCVHRAGTGPTGCPRCDWVSCERHRDAVHLCDPSEPLYDQASDPDWPVNLPLRHHPDGPVDVDGLVDEIYAHLEQQR